MSEDPTGSTPAPRVVGPYRLLEKLGEGGMGVVYRAEQTEPVRREVALKILLGGMDSEKFVARFEGERQALAVMDHPCIAKVLDAGNTEDGRPYFVMELVDGVSLTEYADRHRLSVRARVELFARVCGAVQHAHAKGVIHRDLKPSNILVSEVDGRPVPRVIDFGIAKAITPDAEDWVRLTVGGDVLGTPAYMSPEQIEGAHDIDVRADIYALGIVLFELLVGALPYPVEAYRGLAAYVANLAKETPTLVARLASLDDTQRTVADARGVDPRVLRRELRGDLEWIVGRATRRVRDERYQTANALALELDRYLSGHPVLAGPPTAAYRARKFVARHTIGVAFSASALLALVAFGVWQSVQAERIRRARDVAETRREQAEGVLDFMLTDLRQKLEPLGQLDIMQDVGRAAMNYFAAIPAEEFSEADLQSRSQALYQIGSVRLDQGDLSAADSAFDESLRLARALSERDPSNPDWLFGVGQAEFWSGDAKRRRGDLDGALEHFDRYLQLSEALSQRDTTNLTWLLEVGYGHTNVGALLMLQGELEDAAEHLARSLEIKEVVAAASPESVSRRYDLARGWFNLALVQDDLGRLREATASLERDIELKESILAEQPTNATVLTTLADSENVLGRIVLVLGDEAAARDLFDRAYRRISGLVARDPENARWRRSQGTALGWVAEVQQRSGDLAAALRSRTGQVEILEAARRMNPEQTPWVHELARARAGRGDALRATGALAEALAELTGALATLDSLAAIGPLDGNGVRSRAVARIRLGSAYADAGRASDARAQWTDAVEALRAELDEEGAPRRETVVLLVQALSSLGMQEDAAPWVDHLRGIGYAEAELARLTGSAP